MGLAIITGRLTHTHTAKLNYLLNEIHNSMNILYMTHTKPITVRNKPEYIKCS